MSKIFVIAGTLEEARTWIREHLEKRYQYNTTASLSDYVYVSTVNSLRGIQDPHGYFIGTWRERKDIRDIVDTMFMNCIQVNEKLQEIRDEVHKLAPTTKQYTPNDWSQVFGAHVEEAAQLLSNEMDMLTLRELGRI